MQERRLRELEAEEGQEELEGNREFRKRQEVRFPILFFSFSDGYSSRFGVGGKGERRGSKVFRWKTRKFIHKTFHSING